MTDVATKRISKAGRRKLHALGYPGYERTESGRLLQLKLQSESLGKKGKWHRRRNPARKDAVAWCEKNLVGSFIPQTLFVFERTEDYVLALLKGEFEVA